MLRKQLFGYIVAVVVTAAATVVLKALGTHVNLITVALAMLLIVLFVATAWGPKPAIVSSLLGVACFNFFFLPPLHTFVVADPENWIALFAFLITAITVGGTLSSKDEVILARRSRSRDICAVEESCVRQIFPRVE